MFKQEEHSKRYMGKKQEHLYILMVVGVVGLFALATLFSVGLTGFGSESMTGAAVKGTIATLCKSTYYDTPMKKSTTQVLYGSQFPDKCYDDSSVSKSPTNKGRYLREYFCEENEVAYRVFDCGKNKCQYGACIDNSYVQLS